ncbi:MAG: thiamine phosphate synthase [Sarcina sp.]
MSYTDSVFLFKNIGGEDITLKSVRVLANIVKFAREARDNGANFPIVTNVDANNVEISLLEDISNQVKNIPIVAIGGIKLSNMDKISHIDVTGYVVISDILGDENIFSKCKEWLNIMN